MKKVIDWIIYNKGLILFYIVFVLFVVYSCERVKRTDDIISPQNTYYKEVK